MEERARENYIGHVYAHATKEHADIDFIRMHFSVPLLARVGKFAEHA